MFATATVRKYALNDLPATMGPRCTYNNTDDISKTKKYYRYTIY